MSIGGTTGRLPGLLQPLASRSFALLWCGLATSTIGDQLFAVVLSWIAVGVLGTSAGYLVSAQAAITLIAALAIGPWADRHDDRRVMVAADLGRAVILTMLTAVWLIRGTPAAWTLFASVVALAVGQALFRPALQSTIPDLVGDAALLPAANALIDTTERIARLLGPGLLGLAAALLPLVHFVTFDVATFLCSAGTILLIQRLSPRPAPKIVRTETIHHGLLRGFAALRREPLMWYTLIVTGGINGAWYATYFVGLPLIIERSGITGPGGSGIAAFGLVISCYGSTNLASTLIVGSRGIARRPARLIFGGNTFGGTGIVLLGLAALTLPTWAMLPAFCVCAATSAIGGPMQDITNATLRQTRLPRSELAACVRAWIAMNNLGLLIALALAPTLFNAIGVPVTIMLGGCLVLIIAATGWLRFAEPANSD